MLKVLRDKTKSLSWILWLIIASFILLIFVGWGGAGAGGGSAPGAAGWAARVGDRVIEDREFLDAYQNTESYYRQQLGASYRRGLFFQPEDILGQLVDRALLEGEAASLGLEAAPAEIAESIRTRPEVQGDDGRFNRILYQRLLAYQQIPAKEFEEREARRIALRKLDELLRSAVTVSEQELERTWLERNQTASIEYLLIPTSEYSDTVEADEAALRSFFAGREGDFDAGPGRLVRWARFDRASAQAKLQDEEEMRAYYEENKDLLYTLGRDQRRARHVLVRVAAGASEAERAEARSRADELARKARAGQDFAALARAESDDATTREQGGDLGPFYSGTYDPAFDELAFSLKEGDIGGPVETAQGFQVLQLTKGEGERVRPFAEVRDLVARGLYAARAATLIRERVELFQTAHADKPDFDAACAAAGVEASSPTWVTRGTGPEGGPGPIAINRAFSLGVGDVSDAIPAPGEQVIVAVLDERESSPRSFEEAREEIEAAYRSERAVELAEAAAVELRNDAEQAGELAAAAGDRPVQTAAGLRKRGSVPGLGFEPELIAEALETESGAFGPVIRVQGGAVVFRVSDRQDFDATRFAADREGLRQEIGSSRYESLRRANVQRLREQRAKEIVLNPAVLEPLRDTQGQPATPLG